MQLRRENAMFAYKTNVFPYEPVSKMSVSVTIDESHSIDAEKTSVYWESKDQLEDQTFNLQKTSTSKWEFKFEKESIGLEEWKNNLKIEYDLKKSDNTCGDIVMRDGHFIHYIAPNQSGSIPKNVILTVDASSSMEGTRMDNTKAAIYTILNTLTDQDTFWLQIFDSQTQSTGATVSATPENLESAYAWVSNNLWAGGSTALYDGIMNSVKQPIDNNRANIMFIISDGKPSKGPTKWLDIQTDILAANSIQNNKGEKIGQKWAIYTFGVGGWAPMSELNKVSNLHMGAGRQVLNDDDIQSQLTSFFNEYSMPLNWNNQFNYAGASEYDCSDTNVYKGQELTCIGKLSSSKECGGMVDLGFTTGNTLLAGDNLIDVSTVIVLFAQK